MFRVLSWALACLEINMTPFLSSNSSSYHFLYNGALEDGTLQFLKLKNLFLKLHAVSVFKGGDWNLPLGQTVSLF